MRHFKPVLSGKGLLAASIAGLLSGHAVAETAGRVSYVTGDVTATGTDGNTRNLKRGDTISTGDKLRTNAGRLQIRLTDGGFVSLQPGTIFGVDEYLYANRKPEESSLFFSLLQGGMRTITGSIGKVNKQSYRVRTPVATIGIRGTGYRARIMRNGGLLVSVGSGFVNVGNRSGDTTAGSGQNIFVADENSKPGLTDEQADLGATGVNGDGDGESTAGNNEGQQENDGVTEGDLLNQQLAGSEGELPDGYAKPTELEPAAPMIVASPKLFEPRIIDGQTSTGGLVTGAIDGTEVFNAGTLSTVDKGSKGGILWGAFSDGASSQNNLFGEGSVMLSANQYLPYIYSRDDFSNLYTTGTATYAATGQSAAYATSGQGETASTIKGTLNSFNLTVNFTDWLMDADLSVSIGSNTYTASGSGISPAGNSSDTFSLYLPNTTGGNCSGSFGCSTDISGFFTNATSSEAAIGAAYNIYGTNDGHISGVAVLGHTGYTADPVLPDPIPAFIASPGISSGATRILGIFQNGALASAQSGTANPTFPVFDAGTLHSVMTDGTGSVHWGVFSNGESALNSLFDNYSTTVSLGTDQFLPYAYGSPLITSYQSGTATYSLQTASAAYGHNGSTASTGMLDYFNLGVNFSNWTLAAEMQVTMAGGVVYNAFGDNLSAGPLPGGSVFNATLDTIGGNCTGPSAGCSTTIGGFFSGELNSQIGVGYAMNGVSEGTIKGAAVLGKGDYEGGITLPNSPTDSYNYAVLACNSITCRTPEQVFATFDQYGVSTGTIGALVTAIASNEGFIDPQFSVGTLKASGVTTLGSLSWGEFSDGIPDVGDMLGLSPDSGLGSTEFASYLVGAWQNHSFTSGSATYSLQGGTAARSNSGGVGTLDYFNLTFNFDFNSFTADFQVSIGSGAPYVVTTDGNKALPIFNDGRFSLYGENFLVNDAACGSGTACAVIDGFFAGETAGQIGVSYLITNTVNDGNISGVAGLQLDGTAGTPATPTNRNGYSLAIADSVNGSFFQGGPIDSYYDSSQTNNYDAAGGLLTSSSQTFGTLDRNTAQTDNVGRNGNLDWGRWYGDGAQITGVNEGGNLTLETNQSLHYVTGPMSSAEALHNIVNLHGQGAEATYTLAGGTTASSTDGRTGTLTGQLTVSFDYSSSSMSADLGLNMSSGNSYTLTGSGISISNFQPVFSSGLSCSSASSIGCSANISGFFSGAQAQQIGLGYSVTDFDNSSVTNGAAAFNQGSITPGTFGGLGGGD